MTNQNNEQVLEIAKKHGFCTNNSDEGELWQFDPDALLAFASALREKDAKLIAVLVDYVKEIVDSEMELSTRGQNRLLDQGSRLLTAAQPTADAFIAEIEERATQEGIIEGLEIAESICGGSDIYMSNDCAVKIGERAAIEKRKQAEQKEE